MSGRKCTLDDARREAAPAPLSPADLAGLEAMLGLLLRPLEHPGPGEWSARVCREAESLCGIRGATASIAGRGEPGGARLVLSLAGAAAPAALGRWAAIERLLAPAVRAGAAAWARREAHLRSLCLAVDAGPAPAFLCAPDGRVLHGNPASAGLPDIAGGPAGLREQAWALARRAASEARGADTLEQHHPGSGWLLRATPLPAPEGEPLVLVSVERRAGAALSDEELRERFRLTDREVEVARLLADGLSNAEIAARLHISPFTARNHVENTMGKLGVPRRSRVGPLLAGGGARHVA
jgi:DNA-binding CsgD family transcriptional regulator